MSKRALMLTAATAALLAGPVLGDDFTDIKTKVTQQIKTSTAANGQPADILIESAGSVVVTTAGPAVEIDSPNTVTNQGTISNVGTDDAIGVQMDATAAGNGPGSTQTAFDSTGTVDLGGTGTGKTGILVGIANGDTSGTFNGGINLEVGSKLTVAGASSVGIKIGDNTTLNGAVDIGGQIGLTGGTAMTGILIGGNADSPATLLGNLTLEQGSAVSLTGDNSIGIHVGENSVLDGNLEIGSPLVMAPTDAKSLTAGGVIGVLVDANDAGNGITGNFTIDSGATVTAAGANAQGVVLLAGVGGNFTNSGNIIAVGTSSPTTSTGNPIGASALAIASSIDQGILNNGPVNSGDTTSSAVIEGNGLSPVLLISPTADGATASGDIHIGIYNPALPEGPFSFVNRGQILTQVANVDQTAVTDIRIAGAGTNFFTYLDGGFFNSGVIATVAGGDIKQAAIMPVTALSLGQGAIVPELLNSDQNNSAPGSISAEYTGAAMGGEAVAIDIQKGASLQKIVNQGSIRADAVISDTTLSGGLMAWGIRDRSGTLAEVDNSGLIGAFATQLDDDSQVAIAIDMGVAKQDTVIDNSGTITGDVVLGDSADRVLVHGTVDQLATITGDISFGGTSNSSGDDYLEVDDHATVTGAITDRAAGRLDVLVNPGGTLNITNDSTDLDARFQVNQLTVGAGGTLGLTLSQTYNLSANPNAGGIVTSTGQVLLNPQALLNLSFGGFLAGQTPGEASQFILIDAPLNQLQLDLNSLQTQICPNVPFLFENGNQQCLTVNTAGTRSDLVLNLIPKTATEIGLTGYALKMFPLANLALANDNELGAAVIEAGASVNGIPLTQAEGQVLYQKIYTQFAPNVTGASRTLAIALTDQATGPVAARQRALRMYAGQSGDTTLWGQEFNLSLNADALGNTIGFRDSGFGFVLGVDGGDPANGRYGGALTFYSGDISEKQPRTSKTSSEWALLTGYTDWRGRGLFLDTQISAGVGQLDGKRLIQVADVTRTAEGDRAGLVGAVGATTGAILTTGSTIFTPLISVDGLLMREEGYTEHGGGDPNSGDAFDLRVQPVYYQSARIFAGADVREDLNLGDFYLQPEARAGYRYDFLSNAEKVKAAFAGAPGTDFELTGPDPDKGNLVLGGSLAATTGAWSVGLNYDYLRGTNGSVSQEGTITLVGRI